MDDQYIHSTRAPQPFEDKAAASAPFVQNHLTHLKELQTTVRNSELEILQRLQSEGIICETVFSPDRPRHFNVCLVANVHIYDGQYYYTKSSQQIFDRFKEKTPDISFMENPSNSNNEDTLMKYASPDKVASWGKPHKLTEDKLHLVASTCLPNIYHITHDCVLGMYQALAHYKLLHLDVDIYYAKDWPEDPPLPRALEMYDDWLAKSLGSDIFYRAQHPDKKHVVLPYAVVGLTNQNFWPFAETKLLRELVAIRHGVNLRKEWVKHTEDVNRPYRILLWKRGYSAGRKDPTKVTRTIENFDDLLAMLEAIPNVEVSIFSGSKKTLKQQITRLLSVDLLIKVHGSGSLNALWMRPNSAFIQIFIKDSWYAHRFTYRNVSAAIDVRYFSHNSQVTPWKTSEYRCAAQSLEACLNMHYPEGYEPCCNSYRIEHNIVVNIEKMKELVKLAMDESYYPTCIMMDGKSQVHHHCE